MRVWQWVMLTLRRPISFTAAITWVALFFSHSVGSDAWDIVWCFFPLHAALRVMFCPNLLSGLVQMRTWDQSPAVRSSYISVFIFMFLSMSTYVCVCRWLLMIPRCVSCSLFWVLFAVSLTLPSRVVVSNQNLPCRQRWLPMRMTSNQSYQLQTTPANQSRRQHSLWTMHASLATVAVTWSS